MGRHREFQKAAKFWCHGCDGVLVGKGERCRQCGTWSGRKQPKPPREPQLRADVYIDEEMDFEKE